MNLLEELNKEAAEIQAYLEITCSDNIEEVVNRGNDLAVYIARTGYMLAQAKELLYNNRKNETMQIITTLFSDMKLSAKAQNALIDGLCSEEVKLVVWLERLNSGCVHCQDWCRTLVSKAKEEIRSIRPIN